MDGRYVLVMACGKRYLIEPIAERDQKIDGAVFKNGGISGDGVKVNQKGGAIRAEDSLIGPDKEWSEVTTLPPGNSPEGWLYTHHTSRCAECQGKITTRL